MKTLLLFLLTPFVFFVHAQTSDTAVIRVEIDSLIKLNRSLIAQQKAVEASPVIHQAEEKCLAAFGEETALYGLIAFNKGRTLYYSGDNAGAEKCYIIAKDIQEKTIGKNHPDYAWSINNLASIYSFGGQYEKAEPLYLASEPISKMYMKNNKTKVCKIYTKA